MIYPGFLWQILTATLASGTLQHGIQQRDSGMSHCACVEEAAWLHAAGLCRVVGQKMPAWGCVMATRLCDRGDQELESRTSQICEMPDGSGREADGQCFRDGGSSVMVAEIEIFPKRKEILTRDWPRGPRHDPKRGSSPTIRHRHWRPIG